MPKDRTPEVGPNRGQLLKIPPISKTPSITNTWTRAVWRIVTVKFASSGMNSLRVPPPFLCPSWPETKALPCSNFKTSLPILKSSVLRDPLPLITNGGRKTRAVPCKYCPTPTPTTISLRTPTINRNSCQTISASAR